jgi:hypothetical protein
MQGSLLNWDLPSQWTTSRSALKFGRSESSRKNGEEKHLARPTPLRAAEQTGTLSFLCDGREARRTRTALIIAAIEADAEYFALDELGFVAVSATVLVSDAVYVSPADITSHSKF